MKYLRWKLEHAIGFSFMSSWPRSFRFWWRVSILFLMFLLVKSDLSVLWEQGLYLGLHLISNAWHHGRSSVNNNKWVNSWASENSMMDIIFHMMCIFTQLDLFAILIGKNSNSIAVPLFILNNKYTHEGIDIYSDQ